MEWPGCKPNKSHLPRITQEGEVCCSAKPRAAVMSTGRTACFYRLLLDRWQHCSPSLFLLLFWSKLEPMENSDDGVLFDIELQECKERLKGGRHKMTHHL